MIESHLRKSQQLFLSFGSISKIKLQEEKDQELEPTRNGQAKRRKGTQEEVLTTIIKGRNSCGLKEIMSMCGLTC